MKQKKAIGDMWMIIVGALIAIAIGGVILFIVPKGLLAQEKNLDALSSCGNQGGECRVSCDESSEIGFFKSGCPFDKDGNGKIEGNEIGDYCCIPK